MSSEKFKKHQPNLADTVVWANVTRYLESRGYVKGIDKAEFLGVKAQQISAWETGERGFGPKTIQRFIDKTGMSEEELYTEGKEGKVNLMRKMDKILDKHPQWKAAMILFEAGDIEGAEKIMKNHLEKKYPSELDPTLGMVAKEGKH